MNTTSTAGFVFFMEDAAQNVFGLCYDKDGNLVNAVEGIEKLQPLPMQALTDAARQGFPFAPKWEAVNHSGKSKEQLEAELEAQHHHIATVWGNGSPTCLYPEKADAAGKQFLIRWFL